MAYCGFNGWSAAGDSVEEGRQLCQYVRVNAFARRNE